MTAVQTKTTYAHGPKENPFDKVGSLLAITIYHERAVDHTGRKTMKYYLKKVNDREHDAAGTEDARLVIELARSVRFIENKLTSRYADNRMTSIQVYFNDNKGGTIEETHPNPLLCKLNITRDGIFETSVIQEIIPTQEGVNWVMSIMAQWEHAIKRTRR